MDIFDLKPLTTDNLIVLGGSLIIFISWFITNYLNRSFELYRRKLDKQDEAFNNVCIIIRHVIDKGTLDDTEIHLQLANARFLLQLYGDRAQIKAYKRFIKSIEEKKLEEANKAFKILTETIVYSVRKNLGLKNYDGYIR